MSLEKAMFVNPEALHRRSQNILLSRSKHWYLRKDDTLAWQKTPIDPRLPNAKNSIYIFAAVDNDTGVWYAEPHDSCQPDDLLCFLTRAWHIKKDFAYYGVPDDIALPRATLDDQEWRWATMNLVDHFRLTLKPLPSGFSAGVHAVRGFDRELKSMSWRSERGIPMYAAQAVSSLCSYLGSPMMGKHVEQQRAAPRSLDQQWLDYMDGLYTTPRLWREEQWATVLNGKSS